MRAVPRSVPWVRVARIVLWWNGLVIRLQWPPFTGSTPTLSLRKLRTAYKTHTVTSRHGQAPVQARTGARRSSILSLGRRHRRSPRGLKDGLLLVLELRGVPRGGEEIVAQPVHELVGLGLDL